MAMVTVYYDPSYAAAAYAFPTTRKARLITENPHIWHVDVSVDPFDCYEPGQRTTLDIVTDTTDYLPTIAQRLHEVQARRFGLCIYNAGMDPHEDCPEGALAGI